MFWEINYFWIRTNLYFLLTIKMLIMKKTNHRKQHKSYRVNSKMRKTFKQWKKPTNKSKYNLSKERAFLIWLSCRKKLFNKGSLISTTLKLNQSYHLSTQYQVFKLLKISLKLTWVILKSNKKIKYFFQKLILIIFLKITT